MTEQIYMKLQDKVKRPIFDAKKIDVNHPHFKRLVDEYVRWFQDNDYKFDKRERFEDDIRSCLGEWDLDGYNLAEHLKETVWVEPDADLVDILDDALYVKTEITREITKQWVTENFLEIPSDVIGKKVSCKIGWLKYENHYITGIKPETYEVTISLDAKEKGGYIIGYENLTFID